MRTNTSPNEDDNKKKETAPATNPPTDVDPPAASIDPILLARERSRMKGHLFAQILRGVSSGASSGIMRAIFDDLLS